MEDAVGGPTKDAGNPARPSRLSRLTLEGYKSFQKETIDFGDVTVLLGANGHARARVQLYFRCENRLSGLSICGPGP